MYDDLMNRKWWFRIWTRQEVIFAEKEPLVMCGRKICLWKAFVSKTDTDALLLAIEFPAYTSAFLRVRSEVMVNEEDSAGEEHEIAFPSSLDHLRDRQRAGKQYSFGYVIVELALTGRATNPLDYVYGLIGLAPAAFRESFIIDYTRSAMTCFHELMVAEWTDEPSFACGILESCSLPSRPSNSQWPSWVPDLANQWRHAEDGMYSAKYWPSGDRWRDTEPGDSAIKITEAGRVVCIPGVTIGVVQHLQIIEQAGTAIDEMSVLCKSIDQSFTLARNEGLPVATSTFGSSSLFKAVAEESQPWSTVFRYSDREFELVPTYSNEATWRMVVDGVLAETLGVDAWDDQNTMLDYVTTEIQAWISMNAAGRRFVSTKEGLVGISVPSVQIGDEVVFLHGASCPFVLRRSQPGSRHYTLVGGAFFSGLMDLDRLDALCEEGTFKETIFRIG